MTKKEELQKLADELALDWNEGQTIAELEKMIAEAQAKVDPDPTHTLVRRRNSRGSTRRITRGLERFQKEMDAFIKEMDMQIYLADGEGKRVGKSDLVTGLEKIRAEVTEEVTELLHPSGEE